MRTAPTNKKVRELIGLVRDGKLIPRPEFQRRLVWKIEDKNHFLDSVLKGYPFPEIYLADGEVDLDTGQGTQLLVDGLQRVSTIVQYFSGDVDLKLTTVPSYKALDDVDKTAFLQYDVAVRDLGAIDANQVIEVFRRINATSYSLTDIEISNAVYRGELKEFAAMLSLNEFFTANNVFNATDYRRMGDLRFALSLVATALIGYFNRDDELEPLLERYNDELPDKEYLENSFRQAFDFISECGFDRRSRIWRKADLFTVLTEIQILLGAKFQLQPQEVVERLSEFYDRVGSGNVGDNGLAAIYYKAALQASNDRVNRLRRGMIIGELLLGRQETAIKDSLVDAGLAQPDLPTIFIGNSGV